MQAATKATEHECSQIFRWRHWLPPRTGTFTVKNPTESTDRMLHLNKTTGLELPHSENERLNGESGAGVV